MLFLMHNSWAQRKSVLGVSGTCENVNTDSHMRLVGNELVLSLRSRLDSEVRAGCRLCGFFQRFNKAPSSFWHVALKAVTQSSNICCVDCPYPRADPPDLRMRPHCQFFTAYKAAKRARQWSMCFNMYSGTSALCGQCCKRHAICHTKCIWM